MEDWVSIGYLMSAALFIFGLKKLGHPTNGTIWKPTRCHGNARCSYDHIFRMQLAGDAQWDTDRSQDRRSVH